MSDGAYIRDGPVQLALPMSYPGFEDIVWDDEAIGQLRESLLADALREILDSRIGPVAKARIREWMESDAIAPFSFRVCAEASGLDPAALRETFHRTVERAKQAATAGRRNAA
jgi:hypothetical protein